MYYNIYTEKSVAEAVVYAIDNNIDVIMYKPGDKFTLGYVLSDDMNLISNEFINNADIHIKASKYKGSKEELIQHVSQQLFNGI